MKTIGMIGGMSWESSAEYYRLINEEVRNRLGGLHSAKSILFSVDFEEVERWQATGDWEKAGNLLGQAAAALEKAGADFIIICTNTMHKVISDIEENISIPVLHIGEATARRIQDRQIQKVGLLGTTYTMEMDFYKSRLTSSGLEVLIPEEKEREEINRIIFEELCMGKAVPSSREFFQETIRKLASKGAEGIVLGCTEIGLLIQEKHAAIPLFDTTAIHAQAAVEQALSK
ncbi:aspartate/glutamate racemase family protein [Planococcus shenhongbingii]|uniref:Aspartate/glutamate racemase family protein n=1 Tax=Planococcus shenhongbingii TaxID=3058398 RepID=A0ABT8NB91_9BACL|nr:aspartate/glutamate racemase family protein [Planococcus sp. N017]MDN7244942.1 aspartate/glutamate racemase family protein [Planococcus sp. N017]